MKILLLGKNGQVGFELGRALVPLGDITALDRHTTDGLCGDVTNFATMRHVFDVIKPDIVVNATAYTAVDKAENDAQHADFINHLAVKNLANLAKAQNTLLLHYSTDYVFDGTGETAWTEDDHTNPINEYGKSKHLGEMALDDSGVHFINLRTSWVYGVHGNNFIKTMLQLAKKRQTLNIIHDQIGAPTSASLIADVTAHIISHYLRSTDKQAIIGHYHLAPTGEASWYDYAQFIFKTAQSMGIDLAVKTIHPISTSEYPTPAKRPHNSRLDTTKLQSTFGLHLPPWQNDVVRTIYLLTQHI